VLLAQGLRREYDDLVALAELDLEVPAGELVALVGANGAGKTTLMGIAAGLLEPSHGTISICGEPAGSVAARAQTSYIPDAPVFYQDLSLNEHLEYIARLHAATDWSSRAPELLEQLGLERWGDKLPTQFSRGMRQKASIALGLIRPFSLLLADEPFDGLDPGSRDALLELLRATVAAGAAVIVSTHRTELTDISSRCLALHDGELVYDGPPDASVIAGHLPS
jgi:ABC-type multidrug transport system ATPase subunit